MIEEQNCRPKTESDIYHQLYDGDISFDESIKFLCQRNLDKENSVEHPIGKHQYYEGFISGISAAFYALLYLTTKDLTNANLNSKDAFNSISKIMHFMQRANGYMVYSPVEFDEEIPF